MVACTNCNASLPVEVFNIPRLTNCPSCGVLMRADVFPALFRGPIQAPSAEALLVEHESSCFYHPKKKAVVPCAVCGRFLCALCDVDLNGRHLCPACIETGKRKSKLKNLENHRMNYDTIALYLALVPILLFWPATIITAPMVLFAAIRYWKKPTSIIPRTKIRFIFASFFAGLQIIGWSVFVYSIVTG